MTRRGPKIPRAGHERAGRKAGKRLLALGARLGAPIPVADHPSSPGVSPDHGPNMARAAAARHSEGAVAVSDPRVKPGGDRSGDDRPGLDVLALPPARRVGREELFGSRAEAVAWVRAEIAELEAAQRAAPAWGAAVGVREERLRGLRAWLRSLEAGRDGGEER